MWDQREQQQIRFVPREYKPPGLGSERLIQTLDDDLEVVSKTVNVVSKSQ